MAGWVSGLVFAKTKLPLSGGEEIWGKEGELMEGSHYPDHHPYGQGGQRRKEA